MKKADVQINATYLVKVAGNLVPVKINREHESGGWEGRSVKSGKTIRIKTAQRLRKPLDDAAHGAKSAAKANPKDWGYPGDLGHVREKLIETLAFLSNNEPQEIEDLLGECR